MWGGQINNKRGINFLIRANESAPRKAVEPPEQWCQTGRVFHACAVVTDG